MADPPDIDETGIARSRMRVKPRPIASRAQHQHRRAFAAQVEARQAKHRRRKLLGLTLALPADKQSMRALAKQAAIEHPVKRID